ncbi:hypothetical protein JCM15765_30640 [Paradesulfitobacterium aromaticivorans]
MIKIRKGEEPEVLLHNKEAWTERYIRLLETEEEIPTSLKLKYRDPEIKEKIIEETHGKCAYCESYIPHISFGDVEHIYPKSKRPDLIFEWSNLTLSCEQCNRTRKKDYYNPDDPIINPYIDDPSEYLIAHGPFISHYPGNRKGELTERILELNRKELIGRRLDRIKDLIPLIDKWATESNDTFKEILREQLLKEAEDDIEYSFTVKQFLVQEGID